MTTRSHHSEAGAVSAPLEIVAELANAHEGDRWLLRHLTRIGIAAGADSIKAQMIFAEELCAADHPQRGDFDRYECDTADWRAAVAETHAAGRRFYVDVFGARSAALADELGVDGVKIHATDVANRQLLRQVAASHVRRVLLGAGGATRTEIETALEVLGNDTDVVLLHGFQGYPTVLEDNQIARVRCLRSQFPAHQVGFADHVPCGDQTRTWLSAVAVGAGAAVIEKHLTGSIVTRGVDHDAAVNGDDFSRFVTNMRTAAAAYGTVDRDRADYGMSVSEVEYRRRVRKTLVAARDLRAGEVLGFADLTLKRSANRAAEALDPAALVGRRLAADVRADSPIHQGALLSGDG